MSSHANRVFSHHRFSSLARRCSAAKLGPPRDPLSTGRRVFRRSWSEAALVLPLTIVGMIETSAMRNLCSPCTRRRASTTAPGPGPCDRCRRGGRRSRSCRRIIRTLIIGFDLGAGREFGGAAHLAHRLRVHQRAEFGGSRRSRRHGRLGRTRFRGSPAGRRDWPTGCGSIPAFWRNW